MAPRRFHRPGLTGRKVNAVRAAVVGGYICMVKVRGGTRRLALDSTESDVGLAGTLWEREGRRVTWAVDI